MDVFAILLSLALLLLVAYRGWSVIFWAPVLALSAAVLSGLPILPTYTELFMSQAAVYFKSFFPIFLLGAVFGKLMETSGMAASIAKKIFSLLGPSNAVLSTVLAAAILTYGGVSMFVCVFAVYPFAAALFKEAGVPKKLLPASIFLGSFTFTMDSIPGTPQIQNLIPSQFFGTDLYAAPVLGIAISITIFAIGMFFLTLMVKKSKLKGEGYGDHVEEFSTADDKNLPHWILSAIPLISVLAINIIVTRYVQFSPEIFEPILHLKTQPALLNSNIAKLHSTWALLCGLTTAIILTILFSAKRLVPTGLAGKTITAGAIGSLLAIVNTASEVGYGNVIATLPGFDHVANALISLEGIGGPLLSECVTVNILAGVTGSASGGLSISLQMFKDRWIELGAQHNIPVEVMHRVSSIAAGGLDTLPHNGAVITLLAVCGMTHRQSYPYIFVLTIFKILMSLFAVFLFTTFGLS